MNINLDYYDKICYTDIDLGDRLYKLFTIKDKKELDLITSHEKLLKKYSSKLKNLSDNKTYREDVMDQELEDYFMKQDAYIDGHEDGLEEGIKENQKEMILNMYKDKLPLETISKYANLSIEEVKEIIENA